MARRKGRKKGSRGKVCRTTAPTIREAKCLAGMGKKGTPASVAKDVCSRFARRGIKTKRGKSRRLCPC